MEREICGILSEMDEGEEIFFAVSLPYFRNKDSGIFIVTFFNLLHPTPIQ
jgi:hypothetical protein